MLDSAHVDIWSCLAVIVKDYEGFGIQIGEVYMSSIITGRLPIDREKCILNCIFFSILDAFLGHSKNNAFGNSFLRHVVK